MTAMLDEKHENFEDLSQHDDDDNAYTLGIIGKHNVVMANLPSGTYGTIEATRTVDNMIRSFRNIGTGIILLV